LAKEELAFGNYYPTVDGTGVGDCIHVMDLAEGYVTSLEHLTLGVHMKNLGIWALLIQTLIVGEY